jgi:hypothetical protein
MTETMPRQARLAAPGTLHYVIVRGIDKRRIKDFPWQRQIIRWGFHLCYIQHSQLRPILHRKKVKGARRKADNRDRGAGKG